MATPSTGAISMAQVNTEIGWPSNRTVSFNDAAVRALAGQGSGTISMSNMRGKTFWAFSANVTTQIYNATGYPGDNRVWRTTSVATQGLGRIPALSYYLEEDRLGVMNSPNLRMWSHNWNTVSVNTDVIRTVRYNGVDRAPLSRNSAGTNRYVTLISGSTGSVLGNAGAVRNFRVR